MSEIKTALERFQAYCASKGIPEKSSLAHIHKMDQFEEHERKELRAAYEALQQDLGLAKIALESKRDLLKSCESALEQSQTDNAAQAKRIAELEENRNRLVVAIHSLASNFENVLGVMSKDDEALKKAIGDINHAKKVAAQNRG